MKLFRLSESLIAFYLCSAFMISVLLQFYYMRQQCEKTL